MKRNTNDFKSPREERVATNISSLPKSGIRDFFELVNSMDNVISLGIGEPDFTTPWHIREAAIYSLENGHTSYTSNLGLLKLREAVCEYVSNRYSADFDPKDECIITVGVSEALDLLLRAIINPGDEIIY
ncbi:MAG: aminotransferase class I/II-fold pyridoxal phosphate-dependent enzyme, partial [Victivallales bacterium]|nr:aminotransferase class I/II-fold pyridoxal phosphate-dependent enzyme [Victivallales bacterium]